jgi:hypothetical protein
VPRGGGGAARKAGVYPTVGPDGIPRGGSALAVTGVYREGVPAGGRPLQAWPGGAKYLIYMARPERFELPTRGQVAQFLPRVVSAVAYGLRIA